MYYDVLFRLMVCSVILVALPCCTGLMSGSTSRGGVRQHCIPGACVNCNIGSKGERLSLAEEVCVDICFHLCPMTFTAQVTTDSCLF